MATSKKSVKKAPKKILSKGAVKTLEKMGVEVPELLVRRSTAITAKFSLQEIFMKSDGRWKIKMLVRALLPKGDHDYSVKLEFDDAPFLSTIKSLEKDISEVEANPTLLQSIDNEKINRLSRRIDETDREMREMKDRCPDIEFVAQTEQIKWTCDTSLVFKVLDSVIEPLNKQRFMFEHYRVVLETI